MAKLTPQEAQEKHARNLINSTPDIEAGIKRVKEAPGIAAGKQELKMKQNFVAAIDNGTWRRRVEAVTLDDWQDKTINKGIPRIAIGIEAAKAKTTDFFGQLFDHQDRLLPKIKQMPNLTLQDSERRMVAFMRGMSEFSKK